MESCSALLEWLLHFRLAIGARILIAIVIALLIIKEDSEMLNMISFYFFLKN